MKKLIYAVFVASAIIATSCSTLRVKQIPKEYINNYGQTIVKAGGSEWKLKKGDVWVVFSDRSDNPTYRRPGGKVEQAQTKFLEPFIVIGEKGDYLRLIKFNSNVMLEKKIKGKKYVDIVGWMHKSKLLLTRQSITDVDNGLKNKYVVAFSDTSAFNKPKLYLRQDSVKVFFDVNNTAEKSAAPLYEIVYVMKYSDDGKKALISTAPNIQVSDVNNKILGWIDNNMILNSGQQLYAELPNVENFASKHKNLMFSPVYHVSPTDEETVNIDNRKIGQIIDRTKGLIHNVKGKEISYSEYLTYSNLLKKINIVFVICKTKSAAQQVASLANTIQNMGTTFKSDPTFKYSFGAVIPDYNNEKTQSIGLTNYTEFSTYLYKHLKEESLFTVSNEKTDAWKELSAAFKLLKDHEYETNLFVIVGETGSNQEFASTSILNNLGYYNCRILGVQMYGGKSDESSNFVLQVQDMIEKSSKIISNYRSDLVIYPEQLVKENRVVKFGENSYKLDYPKNSATQGYMIFPSKTEYIEPNKINISLDSILVEIKADNELLSSSMNRAFYESGNNNNRYDNALIKTFNLDLSHSKPISDFTYSFKKEIPLWYMPQQTDSYAKSNVDYNLLLSEAELKSLQNFISDLSSEELDYGYTTTQGQHTYLSSSKARKHLIKLFIEKLNENKPYPLKKIYIKDNYNLINALKFIMQCEPQYNGKFNDLQIRKIKDSRSISDADLDALITYFKNKKEKFNKAVNTFPQFESNGEKYFWVNQTYLP